MEQVLSGVMGGDGYPFIAYTLFCICVVVNVIKYTHQLFVLLILYVKEAVLSFIWDCCNHSTPLSLLPLAPLCKLGESVDPECLLCTFSPPLCGPMSSFDKQTTFFSYLCCVSVVLRIVISWYLFGVFGQAGSVFVLFYFCSQPPPHFPAQFREWGKQKVILFLSMSIITQYTKRGQIHYPARKKTC